MVIGTQNSFRIFEVFLIFLKSHCLKHFNRITSTFQRRINRNNFIDMLQYKSNQQYHGHTLFMTFDHLLAFKYTSLNDKTLQTFSLAIYVSLNKYMQGLKIQTQVKHNTQNINYSNPRFNLANLGLNFFVISANKCIRNFFILFSFIL